MTYKHKFIRYDHNADPKIEKVQRITIRNRERIEAVIPEAAEFNEMEIRDIRNGTIFVNTRGEFKYIFFPFSKFVTKANNKYYIRTRDGVTEVEYQVAMECKADDELFNKDFEAYFDNKEIQDLASSPTTGFGSGEEADDFEGFSGVEEEFEDSEENSDFGVEPDSY